jgi:RNA polymerase sigma-70 factor (ECF subfamily)
MTQDSIETQIPEISDEVALESAVKGDKEAFAVLYERYVRRIYSYVYYRTGNSSDAEDLTAKVFFKAYNHIGNYRYTGVPFSAWLFRIAHNLIANWHRDNSRNKEVPLDDQPEIRHQADVPETQMVKDQKYLTLMEKIRKMPSDRQTLIILKFVEQLSNAEIGVIMGRSEGAIKSLYHRTLDNLRDELIELDF